VCKLRYIITAVAVLAFSSPPAAHAITAVDSTFTFAGTCSDCGIDNGAGTATGTLVLQGYTLGQILQSSNFVSFTYTSIFLGTLSVDSSEFQHFSVTSELADLPGFETVAINWIDGEGNDYQFQSGTDGTWSVEAEGGGSILDVGTNGTWSATPLPATLPLFAGGLGFVGYLTKRRKQNAKQALVAA
jgi:hypothetical protein